METILKDFWKAYLDTLPEGKPQPETYTAWHFCNTEEPANRLGDLARQGIKTATSSLLWAYEVEGEAVPQAGDFSIIINWNHEPLCIIETTEVTIKPFNEVDAAFAYDEGEGDRSLAYWRRVHWEAFSEDFPIPGHELTESMPVVCERFRVVYHPAE